MLNYCTFIGNLGNPCELKYTPTGKAVATFSIACNEKWKDKDGNQQEATEWIRCVAWDRLAGICGEYLGKGQQIFISGKMKTRKWQNQDGKDQYTTEIIVKEMKMLGSKSGSGQGGGYGGPPTPQEPELPYKNSTGDDAPF